VVAEAGSARAGVFGGGGGGGGVGGGGVRPCAVRGERGPVNRMGDGY
jgi:hypothetical protein